MISAQNKEISLDMFEFAPDRYCNLVNKKYEEKGDTFEEYKAWIEKVKKDGKGRIANEFSKLQKSLQNPAQTSDNWKKNKKFNRFEDMPCFDDTRVVLTDGLTPDYIHANWINGYRRRNAYILCQGPLETTIIDFWRTIWQESIATIVMVTKLEENGKVKCARYFPLSNDSEFVVGFFTIKLLKIEKRAVCQAMLLSVTNDLTKSTRHVVHVFYKQWPDQRVPKDFYSLRHFLNFLKIINANMSDLFYKDPHKRGPPILYHCSAGVGRSASLVAIDVINEAILHWHVMDPHELVVRMRNERYHIIHTKIQLLFVYFFTFDLVKHFKHRFVHRI